MFLHWMLLKVSHLEEHQNKRCFNIVTDEFEHACFFHLRKRQTKQKNNISLVDSDVLFSFFTTFFANGNWVILLIIASF